MDTDQDLDRGRKDEVSEGCFYKEHLISYSSLEILCHNPTPLLVPSLHILQSTLLKSAKKYIHN